MRRLRHGLVRATAELAEGLRIALGTLATHRLRSFLTMLGIVIGVTTVIAIIAIIQGLDHSFQAQVAGFGANTLYVSKWKWISSTEDWYLTRNRRPITLGQYREVARGSRIATASSPQVWNEAVLGHAGRTLSRVAVLGVGEGYLEVAGFGLGPGRFFVESDLALDRPVIVIGAGVADALFPGMPQAEIVGQRVQAAGWPLTVVGVLARRGRFLDQDMDKRALLPIGTFGRLFGMKRSLTLAIAGPPEQLEELEGEVTGLLRRARGVAPGAPDDFTVNKQDQLLKVYRGLTSALYGVALGIGLITLVVGGIGIMNIMLVSVHERTREIGVRRALGARRRTVLAQFILEACVVSALGGGVGTALGLAVAQLIALATPLAAAVTPSAVVLGLGFSAAVGILFGAWPAWRAANLDPVEALRWE